MAVYSLAVFTSLAYPLYTGQMSLTPALPIGVVTYEGIALGAVLSIFFSVLLEGGILRIFRATPLGEEVAKGRAVISMNCADEESRSRVSGALEGAIQIAS